MRLSVITDEIDPRLDRALAVCEALGIATVELRVVDGHQLVEHDDAGLRRVRTALDGGGFDCRVVDTPFLKQHVPTVDEPVLERGLAAAQALGAGWLRVFSGLRDGAPADVGPWLAAALTAAAERARQAGVRLALEIEHVCNVATSEEARRALDAAACDDLGVVWDPGNEARFLGRPPEAAAFALVRDAVVHVHVKDVDAQGDWVLLGTGIADWPARLDELRDAGYDGLLAVETHYADPDGGPAAATRATVAALRRLAADAEISFE